MRKFSGKAGADPRKVEGGAQNNMNEKLKESTPAIWILDGTLKFYGSCYPVDDLQDLYFGSNRNFSSSRSFAGF